MNLVPYKQIFKCHIENYYLEDLSYSAPPNSILKNAPESYFPVLCFEKKQLVCFFILDSGTDKQYYTKSKNSLLLRAFSTDSYQTKKGYATSSLLQLPFFVKKYFPSIAYIYLGVNKKNDLAIHLYEKVGFKNTNRIYNGPKGVQKILVLKI